MTQIIKVPGINAFGRTDGCRDAGNAVINQLVGIFSNEKNNPINKDLLDLEEIHVDNNNLGEQEALIFKNAAEAFQKKEKIIFLGGDHSISYSTCRAFLEFCKKTGGKACLIVFDAHPDVLSKTKNPSHEEWLRALIEKGFPRENILLVGVRNPEQDEIRYLAENKIRQINLNQLNNNLEETTDVIMEFALGKELYISFDIDIIDPAFAPATGYKEPGGLTSRQAIYILSRMSLMKNLRALDIVEVNSVEDAKFGNMTCKLAAKLLAEFL